MAKIKIFQYIKKYDAFEVTPEYHYIASQLGLIEWTPVVWITRLLTMDNDFGEHVFDNWDERENLEKNFGIKDASQLLIVAPWRFQDGHDGPCNTAEFRKRFWTDVLDSMHLSLETLFEKARTEKKEWENSVIPEKAISNLEARIKKIREKYA